MALFGKDKKKEATSIVSAMPPPGEMDDEDASSPDLAPEGDVDAEGKSAAEASAFGDLRQALMSSKDDAAGVAALKEFLELCGYTKG